MIPSNFEYYKPTSIQDAVNLYHHLQEQGRKPMYFGGGTEIITLGRIDLLYTDAIIDINEILECNELIIRDRSYILGSALSLTQVVYQDTFLLLSKTVNEIADQTARNKISLGGNICSNIRFKEAILPFLVTNSKVMIANINGIEVKSITEAFNQDYQLDPGTLLIHVMVDENSIKAPYYTKKIRTIGTVGYPVITVNAVKLGGRLRIAESGASNLPIQADMIDEALNNRQLSYKDRIRNAIEIWPKPIIDDIQGSASYKKFLLEKTILDIFHTLEVD